MKSEHRRTLALCTLAVLAPGLRLYPSAAAALAGRSAWLSPLLALPPLLVYAALLSRDREDLPRQSLRVLGPRYGRALLLLFCAWLLLEAGFILRSGAERFVVALFPQSRTAPFVVSMGIACLAAALASAKSLGRLALLVLPAVLGALLLILLFSLPRIKAANLLPLSLEDTPAALKGSLPVLDALALGLYLPLFFGPPPEARMTRRWLCGLCALLGGIGLAVQGCFGAGLSARLSLPFFTLVRNLIFFRSLERIEALIVALWIFPDFLLVSALLQGAQRCLRLCLGTDPAELGRERFLSMADRRWLIPLCALFSILIGLTVAPDQERLLLWSERLIPLGNLGTALVLIPLLRLLAARREEG